MIKSFFRELAIKYAPKQALMVDAVTEEAPLLAMLPMQEASHGLRNVYELLKDVQGAQIVYLDDELPDIGVTTELGYQDLGVLGGVIRVGEDHARSMGGAMQYFANKMPSILRVSGANTEKSFIYNNIRPYSKTNGNQQSAGGTAVNKQYSMICVKWVPGETIGLYDPKGFGNGKVFDMLPINGGNLYEYYNQTDQKTYSVYGMRIKTYTALQLANPRNVSSIVNIDLTQSTLGTYDALPTIDMVNKMIRQARGNPSNTFIYAHPAVVDALGAEYKTQIVRVQSASNEINTIIAYWNNIRIVGSYNFDDGTEAVAV